MNVEIIGDPLFQLNLVLFISLPGPSDGTINPVLYNMGYRIESISPNISIPLSILNDIKENNINSNSYVKPEVILRHIEKNEYLLIECKRSSFSSESSTSKQAIAYLVLNGMVLKEVFGESGSDDWRSKLLYVVKAGDEELLSQCLNELSQMLQQVACTVIDYNVCGVGQGESGIYLNTDFMENIDLNISGNKINVLTGGSNYRPLYLIPYDINVGQPDEYTKSVLKERIRSSLAAQIITSLGEETFVLDIDTFLQRIILLWDVWEDNDSKKDLRRSTKRYIKFITNALKEKYALSVVQHQNTFSLGNASKDTKLKIINYFRSKAYRKGDFDIYPEETDQLELDI